MQTVAIFKHDINNACFSQNLAVDHNHLKKMVKLEETFTNEIENIKPIKVLCKICSQELVEFEKVTVTNRIWKIKEDDLDWDVVYSVKYGIVFCKCAQIIARIPQRGIFQFVKKAVELKY